MAVVLGLAVTSSAFAGPGPSGEEIGEYGPRGETPGSHLRGGRGGRSERGERGPGMRPVFESRGYALGGEDFELFGMAIFPIGPKDGEENQSEESTEKERPSLENAKFGGIFTVGKSDYLLTGVEVSFEDIAELQGQEEELDEGEEPQEDEDGEETNSKRRRRRRRRRPMKRISSVTANLVTPPEGAIIDEGEESQEDEGEYSDEGQEEEKMPSEDIESLPVVGTITFSIEVKGARQMKMPIVRGQATADSVSYELYGKPEMGMRPGPRGEGEEGEESGEGENEDDGEYIDGE